MEVLLFNHVSSKSLNQFRLAELSRELLRELHKPFLTRESRTRESGEQVSPNRVRQVVVSPVRDQREQYRISPAKEQYVQYVTDENFAEGQAVRSGSNYSSSKVVTRTSAGPSRMSYTEAKEHFGKKGGKSVTKVYTTSSIKN